MNEEEARLGKRRCLMFECVFWVYHLLVCCLAMFILSQVVYSYWDTTAVKQLRDYRYSLETIDMWNKGYIIDIRVVSTNNCPQGYTPLINYHYVGTDEGCYCSSFVGSHLIDAVLPGECTTDLVNFGCQKIPSISQLPLQMWKGSKLICTKRAQALNFYSSTNTTTAQETSMKKCADTKEYQVYTLPGVSCPITSISNTTIDSSQVTLSLDVIHGRSLYHATQKAYPIADFKLTEYQFCPFFDQTNISPNKSGNYLLQKKNRTVPCSGTDSRIKVFDQLNEEQFLTNNTRVYDRISSLPGYPRPSSVFIYKLGYIPYPDWTYTCRTSKSHSLMAATQHLTFNIQIYTMFVTVVITGCIVGFFGVLLRLFFIVRHVIELRSKVQFNALLMSDQQVSELIPTLNIKKSFGKQFFLFMFELLLRAGLLFAMIYGMFSLMDESDWLKSMFSLGCTNTFIQNILRQYEIQVDSGSQRIVYSLVIWVILVIADIVYFIIRVRIGDLKTKEVKVMEVQQSQRQAIDQKDPIIMNLDYNNQEQSSEAVLKNVQKQVRVYDIDNFMENDLGETKGNFYDSLENQQSQIIHRKKKKKGKKRKNLFKDAD